MGRNSARPAPAAAPAPDPAGDKKQLQVLIVAPELYPWRKDGVTEVVRGLSNAQAERDDVRLSVLATVPRGADTHEAGYSRRIRFYRVRKLRLPEPLFHLYVQTVYAAVVTWWAWRNRNSARVVHFEILPGARAGLAALAATFTRLPRLVTIHGWPPKEIPLEKGIRRRLGCRAHWWLAKALLTFFPAAVVNSRHMRTQAADQLKRQGIAVIPNGIDWAFWSRAGNSTHSSQSGLGWWGRFEGRKGIWVLLEAYCRLSARTRGNCPPLYLAGDGACIPEVRRWIAQRGLEGRVILLGELSHTEIRDLAGSLWATVSPSEIEPFGIAVLEAMASGTAVVVADKGGPSEFVVDRENGLHFRAGDPESLCSVLLELCSDPALRERIASAARASAQRFEWREIASRYVALYRAAAQKNFVEATPAKGKGDGSSKCISRPRESQP